MFRGLAITSSIACHDAVLWRSRWNNWRMTALHCQKATTVLWGRNSLSFRWTRPISWYASVGLTMLDCARFSFVDSVCRKVFWVAVSSTMLIMFINKVMHARSGILNEMTIEIHQYIVDSWQYEATEIEMESVIKLWKRWLPRKGEDRGIVSHPGTNYSFQITCSEGHCNRTTSTHLVFGWSVAKA